MSRDYFGIDISRWQKNIDYAEASKAVDFVIIKAGGSEDGFYKDSMFEEHYKMFHDIYNKPCGCYYFVGPNFYGEGSGVADANRFINIIKGKKFEYPVSLDIETTLPARKLEATAAAIAFCDTMEKAGYYVNIYASDISGFKDRLYLNDLKRFDKWVARYGCEPQVVQYWNMWQYSSSGNIAGIPERVDLDKSKVDFSAVMKRSHLNGY